MTKPPQSWEILFNYPSEEGIRIVEDLNEEIKRNWEYQDWNNIFLIYLDAKRYREAREILLRVIDERRTEAALHFGTDKEEQAGEYEYIHLGYLDWVEGDTESALDNWKKATKTKYVLYGEGVISYLVNWYAAKVLRLEKYQKQVEKKLMKFWSDDYLKLEASFNPKVLVGLIFDKYPVEYVTEYLKSKVGVDETNPLEIRWKTKVYFCVGMTRKDRDEACMYYRKAVNQSKIHRVALIELLYFFAKYELERCSWNQ